jgi:hypothetical protein
MTDQFALAEIARIVTSVKERPTRRIDRIYRVLVQVGAISLTGNVAKEHTDASHDPEPR